MWYYIEFDRQIGPVDEEEFTSLVKAGRITATTPVWREGMREWLPYGQTTGSSIEAASSNQGWAFCSECRKPFLEEEMVRFQDSLVCHTCKPLFFQRLKEGAVLPGTLAYAGFWVRFFAKLIDGIIVWIVEVAILIGFGILFGSTIGDFTQGPSAIFFILFYPLIFGLSIGYSVFFLGKYGATPGKMALGLRVVNSAGEPINYTKALIRFFAEILSAIICYIGYIMVAFDEERKALHDQLCDTRVIRK